MQIVVGILKTLLFSLFLVSVLAFLLLTVGNNLLKTFAKKISKEPIKKLEHRQVELMERADMRRSVDAGDHDNPRRQPAWHPKTSVTRPDR